MAELSFVRLIMRQTTSPQVRMTWASNGFEYLQAGGTVRLILQTRSVDEYTVYLQSALYSHTILRSLTGRIVFSEGVYTTRDDTSVCNGRRYRRTAV